MNKLDKNGLIANEVQTDSLKIGEGILVDENNNLKWNDSEIITSNGGTITANGLYLNSCNLNINGNIYSDSEKKVFDIGYSYSEKSGSLIALRGINHETEPDSFAFIATDGSDYTYLKGYPNGNLTWNGDLTFNCPSSTNSVQIGTTKNHTNLVIGLGNGRGGSFQLNDNQYYQNEEAGAFVLNALDKNGNMKSLMGSPSSSLTWGGSKVVTYSLLNNLDSNIYFTTESSRTSAAIGFNGSANGARCVLYSKNNTKWTGYFQLLAGNSSTSASLVGKPDGGLTWNSNEVITNFSRSHIYFDPAISTSRDIGYTVSNNSKRGACLTFKAGGDSTNPGMFLLNARDESSSAALKGYPNGDLIWNGGYIMPVGTIVAYTSSTIPEGWLYCNGGAVSRTTYAKLFSVIGTKYGAGDGSTTFNLPGTQGYFLQGYTSGAAIGSKASAGLPDIQGTVNLSAGSTGARLGLVRGASGAYSLMTAAQTNPNSVGNLSNVYEGFSFKASSYNSVYGRTSSTVQPPAIMVAYIIKYK